MLRFESGKDGYGLFDGDNKGTPLVPRRVVLRMLRMETRLRLSADVQKRYTECANDVSKIAKIDDEIQQSVVKMMHWGTTSDMFEALLRDYRRVRSNFAGDDELLSEALWCRYDRTFPRSENDSELLGSEISNFELRTLCGEQVMLHDELEGRDLVIVTGSQS
jgi:hypothetical protein